MKLFSATTGQYINFLVQQKIIKPSFPLPSPHDNLTIWIKTHFDNPPSYYLQATWLIFPLTEDPFEHVWDKSLTPFPEQLNQAVCSFEAADQQWLVTSQRLILRRPISTSPEWEFAFTDELRSSITSQVPDYAKSFLSRVLGI